MSEPKKWNYPRLYMRISKRGDVVPSDIDESGVADAVIIHPYRVGAQSCFSERVMMDGRFSEMWSYVLRCCWEEIADIKSPEAARRKMFETAKANGFETIFLGEIK